MGFWKNAKQPGSLHAPNVPSIQLGDAGSTQNSSKISHFVRGALFASLIFIEKYPFL
jgi:hypothetical protein